MLAKLLAGLGTAVLVVSIILNVVFPADIAWMPEGFTSPIIAFEFLHTTEEVKTFFGPPSQERSQWLDAMILGHQIDYLYLLLYGLFLALWGVFAAKRSTNQFFYLITMFSLVAAVSDMLENWQLVAMVEQIEKVDFAKELKLLHIFTWLKWGSLALSLVGMAYYLYKQEWLGKVFAFISVVTLILGVLAFNERSVMTTYFSLGIVLQFGVLIIYSWVTYFRNSKKEAAS